ncbi:N-acetylated-alpha-linked acidic dipeptidase 2-like [Lytechinus pictus]|uniref:N-acetylated-alpha-linked acidic dipeptidase 2-like n=1 Tax=Lytechinus pictus TaxID=7653 RepID=UPI0030B9EEAA
MESTIHPASRAREQQRLAFMSLVAPNADEAFVVATMQDRYKRSVTLAVGIAILCVGIGIGVLVGHFSAPSHAAGGGGVIGDGGGGGRGSERVKFSYSNFEAREADETITDRLMKEMSAERIRDNLRHYASKPHVAGTPADLEGAQDIMKTWLDQGLDSARLVPYKVYLQHPPSPDHELANKVQIINPINGSVMFTSSLREDSFDEEELEQEGIPPPFNAYSATGDVTGDLVYINYGRLEDYEYLQNLTTNINFKGKILIAKYGMTGRNTKVVNAEKFGAAGLILFSDPRDLPTYGLPHNGIPYPRGSFLPKTAAQRGSILKDIGDPLTPGYPAKDFAYRLELNDTSIPKIPVHPIGFEDAEKLLSALTGPQPGDGWNKDPRTIFEVGPGFKEPYIGMKVRLVVNSISAHHYTYNTVGFIRGDIEPDRYVIVGNHRDAWALGAVDPTSGTATLMEVSRAFGKLKQEGWRPRRTIIFCSFAAEEYGLIGSIEWTEEFNHLLADRTIAYLNLDIAVAGNYVLWTSASPHLRPVVYAAAKKIPDPDNNERSLYDTMVERKPDDLEPHRPHVRRTAGASDHRGFIMRLGVPFIMIFYGTINGSFYSLYHTSYETIRLVEEYIDPDYSHHLATTRVFAEMTRILADSLVLPFDVHRYSVELLSMWIDLNFSEASVDLLDHGISLERLKEAVYDFMGNCTEFQERVSNVNKSSPSAVRQINDQMMQLEKAFIKELPDNRLDRHVLFSPRFTEYDARVGPFPGIADALHKILQDSNQETRWKVVSRQVAILTHAIEAATAVLKDVTSW